MWCYIQHLGVYEQCRTWVVWKLKVWVELYETMGDTYSFCEKCILHICKILWIFYAKLVHSKNDDIPIYIIFWKILGITTIIYDKITN
jgi:uncharacterized membrane protein YwaF